MHEIAAVRRFSRTVTQRTGALSDRFLGRGRPLAAARVLWEIGPEGLEVRALRARLELDSGHASRLLRSLEDDGLVEVVPSVADRRVRAARLTAAGRAEWATLDRRSDELAESLLAPLSERQQAELVAAMRVVERLLVAASVRFRVVDPRDDDARSCIRSYFAELDRRSETGFDPSQSVQIDPDEVRPPAGALLVAYRGAEALACGAVRHGAAGVSEIKRMWVSETIRGVGLGRRLLAELERRAAQAGARAVRLDTNHNLVEAIALYRASGYVEIERFNDEPFADHWFEKRLSPALRAAAARSR